EGPGHGEGYSNEPHNSRRGLRIRRATVADALAAAYLTRAVHVHAHEIPPVSGADQNIDCGLPLGRCWSTSGRRSMHSIASRSVSRPPPGSGIGSLNLSDQGIRTSAWASMIRPTFPKPPQLEFSGT